MELNISESRGDSIGIAERCSHDWRFDGDNISCRRCPVAFKSNTEFVEFLIAEKQQKDEEESIKQII